MYLMTIILECLELKINFFVKNMIFSHNLRFLYWLRKAEKGNFLGKILCYRYSRKYGLEISPSAKIGKGLYLGHPYNITVGSDCIIEKMLICIKDAQLALLLVLEK